MKKILIIILVLTLVFCGLNADKIIDSAIIKVDIITPSKEINRRTVSRKGQIVSSTGQSIILSYSFVPQFIKVKEGEYVNAGQILFTVDKTATMNLYSGVTGADSYVNIIPSAYTAPINGYVSYININEGVKTEANQCLIYISTNSGMYATVNIEKDDSLNLSIGEEIGLLISEDLVSGKITKISSDNISVSVDDKNKFKIGSTVDAVYEIGDGRTYYTLPYEAINQDENGNEYVYVYSKNKVIKKIIKTGKEYENCIEILSGINTQDKIVLNPGVTETGKEIFVLR